MPVYSVPEWPIFLLARCVELFQLLTRCRVPGDLGDVDAGHALCGHFELPFLLQGKLSRCCTMSRYIVWMEVSRRLCPVFSPQST